MVADEIERAATVLNIYERVHAELDEGKPWSEIDSGLRIGTQQITYDHWLAYMRQSLINNLRSIVLARKVAAVAELPEVTPLSEEAGT